MHHLQKVHSLSFLDNLGILVKVFEKIRSAREAKQWSQEFMAEKLEMSASGYAKIERGETRINIPRLEQISEILEISVFDLLDNTQSSLIYQANHGDNNTDINFFANSDEELQFEIRTLQLTIRHLKELLIQKDKELEVKDELIRMYKAQQNH